MAELIIQKERKLEEIRIIVEGWNVPESQKFPNGIKYSYQAYNQKNGKTILRYDNHNKHAGSRNHKHIGNETEKLEHEPENREDLQEMFQEFMKEVKELK